MILDASCELKYNTPGELPAIFMLRPRSGWAQWIMREEFHIAPHVPVVEFTDLYGNLCQRMIMPGGNFDVSVKYRVSVPDEVDSEPLAPLLPAAQLPTELLHFLLPSRYCQSDKMSNLANQIVGTTPQNYHQISRIEKWIHSEIRYEYGTSNSSTSALETANRKIGVCRDFAHLGIALCRALNVPARMVVGFLYNLKPMDLHAWFEAYINGRWFTFDGTQSSPKGNRIIVAYGRDAADVALATLFGNFTLVDMKVSVEAVTPP